MSKNIVSVEPEKVSNTEKMKEVLSEGVHFVRIEMSNLQNIVSFIELMHISGIVVLDSDNNVVSLASVKSRK
ncbi:MAG: hypothetical protein JXR95_16680 [Deltaproteobacteria bacterium]|nr:hypothetical protein [Deltaproteobacteria bacterium]